MTALTRLRRHHRPSVRLLLFVVVALATACAGGSSVTGPSEPTPTITPGWLTLQLDTPRSNDGAVQLLVTGPGIDDAKAVGYDGYAAVVNGTANLLVTGAITGGTVAQVHVADVSRANEYQASIVAAAVRSTYALQDLTGYRAVLVR